MIITSGKKAPSINVRLLRLLCDVVLVTQKDRDQLHELVLTRGLGGSSFSFLALIIMHPLMLIPNYISMKPSECLDFVLRVCGRELSAFWFFWFPCLCVREAERWLKVINYISKFPISSDQRTALVEKERKIRGNRPRAPFGTNIDQTQTIKTRNCDEIVQQNKHYCHVTNPGSCWARLIVHFI